MSENNSNRNSKTDWAGLDAMTDEDIDTSDIPPLDEEFFANAELRMPKAKSQISMRVDSDVLAWFKEQGTDYQARMNAVLRLYMEAQTRGSEQ